ncbi:MAG TPA: pilus assembly protein TadG-related protein [Burkholderiaceae bacterium]|nr:pilus assembly protein TadG-related protein [Burkholderiaceae bacterium]
MAIIVGLTLAVLIGFAGLALDLGRLYVNKSELQNAADACALAAARELACDPTAGPCPASYLESAEMAGMFIAARNNKDFQDNAATIAAADVRFSTTLAPNSSYLSRGGGADPASKYAMCIARAEGILPWFMGVLGFGAQSVSATAVATLAPAQTNCGIPLAMCSKGPASGAPPFGLNVGQWYNSRFSAGGGISGNFNWIDFTPPTGGESELSDLMTGSGVCALNVTTPVGQTGSLGNAMAKAYNSRFGLYMGGGGNPSLDSAPPDFTGYSYTATNWPAQSNALGDFLARRNSHDAYGTSVNDGNAITGLNISNAYNPTTTSAQHKAKGADRRLVVAPIVDCAGWETSNTTTIQAWACVLLLHPIGNPNDDVFFEYRGLSSDLNSPCATSGSAGGPGSVGPQVPTLVQ